MRRPDVLLPSMRIAETATGVRRVAKLGFESKSEVIDFLIGKKVLNLGSGTGLFAKEAYSQLFYDTTIVSMNPRLMNSHFRMLHENEDRSNGFYDVQDEAGNVIKNPAVEMYESTAVAAVWEALPFAAESFDAIFANGSFLFYSNTYSDEVMRDLIRIVKKKTGQLRIEVDYIGSHDYQDAVEVATQLGCKTDDGVHVDRIGIATYYLIIYRGEK